MKQILFICLLFAIGGVVQGQDSSKTTVLGYLTNVHRKIVPLLYVIDGVLQDSSIHVLAHINPAIINSINTLTIAQAISKYGKRGKYGAIEIITSKPKCKNKKQ